MSSASFLKSKAFKEREENARERIRQVVKQDLVADLSRLFGDIAFSDVLFMVKNVEFHAHTAILRARAPNFCRHFLPSHTSPVSVQTCIQVHGLEAAEFEEFLRSVYTDDGFKDYCEFSHPWRRQAATSSAQINHVMSGICTQLLSGVISSGHPSDHCDSIGTSTLQNFDGQEDNTCTQSGCASDTSNNEEIISGDMALENIHPAENNDKEADISKPSQCDSSCLCMSDTKCTAKECNGSSSLSNRGQDNETSFCTSHSTMDNTSQFAACSFVDGPTGNKDLSAETVCHWSQTRVALNQNNTCILLCSDMADGEREAAGTACKMTSSIENGFHSGCTDLIANHTSPNKTSESDLEFGSCSCNLGKDLLHLLTSEVGSDVTFLVNGEKVKAHKAILCARSNYFAAMLHGDWIEGKTNEIPLVGVNHNGLMTVLRYIYGGTIHVKSDLAVMCDTLPLVDMYGLEGLKEVIICTLRIDKCHLFHKPCSECITGVSECLEVSELFSLTELKKSCVKWIAKHFDRVLGTKGFATLPKQLQEEVLVEIKQNFAISSAIEVLNHCDRLSSCTPLVKWTEPVHVVVSSIQESCLLFIINNFFSLIDEKPFHEMLKGVGWSIPVLEKIISSVNKNLSIENCCDQLRAVLRLNRLLKLRATEESEECYPEEVSDLLVSLHNHCVKFIRSNLFKVTRSVGWKKLKLATQREIKEGAVFSGFGGESGDRRGAAKGRNGANFVSSSSRQPIRSVPQRAGTDSRARGLGRGGVATNGQLSRGANKGGSSSSMSYQTRTGGYDRMNRRPFSGRPSSGQSSATSSSKDISEKRRSSSRASVASGNSRPPSSFPRNSSDKRSSSVVSGHGRHLPSQGFSNEVPHASRSRQSTDKAPVLTTSSAKKSSTGADKAPVMATSSGKKRSSLAPGTSNGRSSSDVSSYRAKNTKPASRPPLPCGNTDKGLREKTFSVQDPQLQKKKAPTKAKAEPLPNTRQCPGQVTRESIGTLSIGNLNELSASKATKNSSTGDELVDDAANGVCSTTQANDEARENGFASNMDEESHSSNTRAVDEACVGEVASISQSSRFGSIQATSAGAENTVATVSAEGNSLTLRESANAHSSGLHRHTSPDDFKDSLELD